MTSTPARSKPAMPRSSACIARFAPTKTTQRMTPRLLMDTSAQERARRGRDSPASQAHLWGGRDTAWGSPGSGMETGTDMSTFPDSAPGQGWRHLRGQGAARCHLQDAQPRRTGLPQASVMRSDCAFLSADEGSDWSGAGSGGYGAFHSSRLLPHVEGQGRVSTIECGGVRNPLPPTAGALPAEKSCPTRVSTRTGVVACFPGAGEREGGHAERQRRI